MLIVLVTNEFQRGDGHLSNAMEVHNSADPILLMTEMTPLLSV